MCDAEDVLAVEVEMKLRPPNELNIRPPTLKHQEISRTFVRRPHISLQLKYRSHCAAHNDVRLTTFPILGILKLGIIYWHLASCLAMISLEVLSPLTREFIVALQPYLSKCDRGGILPYILSSLSN